MLDDTVPTDLYPKQRDGDEGWGWTSAGPDIQFDFARIQQGSDLRKVGLLVSVSGSVDEGRLPSEVDESFTIYELSPVGVLPAPGIIGSPSTLDAFSRTWRELLAAVEANILALPPSPRSLPFPLSQQSAWAAI